MAARRRVETLAAALQDSEEQLHRLFEPLQRGQSSAPSAARSIGLGLFIVRAIVEGLGGRVEVRSSEGEGTTFSVFLPHGG